MTKKITVMVTPRLRSSIAKVAALLKENRSDSLFLPLSRALERYLTELVEGLSYEYVISQLRKSRLIPEPFGAWKYNAEPLSMNLPQIKQCNTKL